VLTCASEKHLSAYRPCPVLWSRSNPRVRSSTGGGDENDVRSTTATWRGDVRRLASPPDHGGESAWYGRLHAAPVNDGYQEEAQRRHRAAQFPRRLEQEHRVPGHRHVHRQCYSLARQRQSQGKRSATATMTMSKVARDNI